MGKLRHKVHTAGGKNKPAKTRIKSAAELGIAAKSLGIQKETKTHRGRKILEMRKPKLIENPKRSFVMKGHKSSETINTLLQQIHMMRGPDMSQLLMRKNYEVLPFEDCSQLEQQSVKYDCSLFCMGSHQKKRPDNLVFGRVFDSHVLDMVEFGVEDFKAMNQFEAPNFVTSDCKPLLIFQGEPFENSEKHKRIKNLFIGKLHITH
jgi:ribosome production factor 2